LQNNLIKLHHNTIINRNTNNTNNKKDDGIFSSSSNSSSNISLYPHHQQLQANNKQNNFQQLNPTKVQYNCETNNNEHFENMISNQEIANNFYNNQKFSDKPLSLCDFTSNGHSSGPSSNISTSSTTSLTSPFCNSSTFQQHLSSFFNNNPSENMNNLQKDEQNPIDRLYSMQNSYFCSKC
jgi:hypothetical protein